MTTMKRALAASAAMVGVGSAAVTLPAEPASAHETEIHYLNSVATVGAAHTGIRVCNLYRERSAATIVYRHPGSTVDQYFGPAYYGRCESQVDPQGVGRYRLCVDYSDEVRCTGWKTNP